MKVAISTNDEKELTKDHFGEGKTFLIYEIEENSESLLEKRENTSPEEEEHGSKVKAQAINSLLQDVPVLLGYQFGPNIMRIKDKFLAIVSREINIEKSIELIKAHYREIYEELNRPRGNIIVMDQNSIRIIKVKDSNAKDF